MQLQNYTNFLKCDNLKQQEGIHSIQTQQFNYGLYCLIISVLTPTGKKTGTGADSTDAEVLGQLAEEHDVPKHILEIRQKVKIKNTYLDKIIPNLDRDVRLPYRF